MYTWERPRETNVCVLVVQLCPTLCNLMDSYDFMWPLGSSVSGILQARILDSHPFPSPEDLSIPFSGGSSPPKGQI